MKILALDSSGLVAGVAVVEDDILRAEYTVNYKKTHSQTLLPMLDELRRMIELDLDTLDAIAVAAGPGSFTGLRIGSATAKGLGLALNKPLVEVPTLEGLAYNLCGTDRLVCPLMDARRGQVYAGIYETVCGADGWELRVLQDQCAVEVSLILDKLNAPGREVIFLGDGAPVYREIIERMLRVPFSFAPAGMNRQRAASVAALGMLYLKRGRTVDAAGHQPVYLRMSQAEQEGVKSYSQCGDTQCGDSQCKDTGRVDTQRVDSQCKDTGRVDDTAAEKDEGRAAVVSENGSFPLVIHRLRLQDVEAVSRIEEEAFSMPWSAKDFKELADAPGTLYLVAEAGGAVAGCCGVTNISGDGDINNVVVAEPYRGKGIAQALLRELLRQGAEMGIENFTLEVRVSNTPAIHIYEKLGFVSEGVRPGFYDKPREDAMIMWRRKCAK